MQRPKGGVMPEEEKNEDKGNEEEEKNSEEENSEEEDQANDDLVKSLKTESIKNKKRAQKAEKELEAIRQTKLSDDEKKDLKIKQLEKDKEDADRKVRDSNVNSMIMGYASTLGFQDLDVVKLIALKELGDEDEISEADVKSVIDLIAKDKPYLLGSGDTTKVGPGNFESGGKPEGEKNIDEMFGDMIKDR